jgi:hypothetical protein
MRIGRAFTVVRSAIMVTVAASMAMLLGAAPSSAADDRRCDSRPYAVAETGWDDGHVGQYLYYLRVKSYLHRCDGGYTQAIHYVLLDGRRLPLGAEVQIALGTRRSDGKWWGQGNMSVASSKNISATSYSQTRGVGGGLTVTHVRIAHFAKWGQTNVPPPSNTTARYVRWSGPELEPRSEY